MCAQVKADAKRERDKLVRAALDSLSQLRTHLTSALAGLKAGAPAVMGALKPTASPPHGNEEVAPPGGSESFGYSARKHRWGVITKGERFGTLVVRLEAPTAPASHASARPCTGARRSIKWYTYPLEF